MKKTLIVLSLLAALSFNACDKKDKEVTEAAVVPAGAQALVDKAEFTEEALLGMIANKAAVTAIEYEALLLAIEKCDIDEKKLELVYSCPALKAIRSFHNGKEYVMAEGVKAPDIKGKFMKSDKQKLQSWLIPQMSSLFGVKDEGRTALLEIEKEANAPIVTKATISTLSNEMSDKAVSDFILSHVDDKNAAIRSAVAISVTSSWSKDVEGIVDIALKFLSDEDKDIRKIACSRLGGLADEQIIDPVVAILKDSEQEYQHSDCLKSLYTLWFDYPFHEKTSETAYKATVDYLSQKPRTDKMPPWMSVGEIKSINKSKIEAWKNKATYFKADEYLALMNDIAADADANWLGRSAAVDVIVAWGTKKDLEDLKVKLAADTGSGAVHVVKAVEKGIAAMDAK